MKEYKLILWQKPRVQRKIIEVPRNPDGTPRMPIHMGVLTIHSLGKARPVTCTCTRI
jgi:hypothetical protein